MMINENMMVDVNEVNNEKILTIAVRNRLATGGEEWELAHLDECDMLTLRSYINLTLNGRLDEFLKTIEPK